MKGYASGSIWPADDDDAVQIREVYSRYGLAMYLAQVLEHGMANAVIISRMLPTMLGHPDRSAWEDAFDGAYDVELAKTFGNMLRALGPLGLPGELLERLRSAKFERDRLAHRFFREHDEDFLGRTGRTIMIAECDEAIGNSGDSLPISRVSGMAAFLPSLTETSCLKPAQLLPLRACQAMRPRPVSAIDRLAA